MNRMTAGHSAPGWYPDPWRSGYSRWWDGVAWTEHSREGAPPTPTVEPLRRMKPQRMFFAWSSWISKNSPSSETFRITSFMS